MKRASIIGTCAMLVAALTPCSAIAEIYKCVQDGKTLYQDQPCRGAASTMVVVSPETSGTGTAATGSDERLSRLRANVNEMARERRKREIAYEVGGLEREIAGYERTENSELAALTDKRDYNNRNTANWQREGMRQSVEAEMRS